MYVYVTTHDHRRQAHWERIFGTARLPVKAAVPRLQARMWQPGQILAYDLDVARLHWMQRERFAFYISRQTRMTIADALYAIEDGWPIEASNCEIIETAVSADTAVFAFLGVFARKHVRAMGVV